MIEHLQHRPSKRCYVMSAQRGGVLYQVLKHEVQPNGLGLDTT